MAADIENFPKWIEFSGLVGSGKTTLAETARNILEMKGYSPLDEFEAVQHCLERSLLGKTFLVITPPGYHHRVIACLYFWLIRRLCQLQFVIRYPLLSLHVYRSSKYRKTLTFNHRSLVLRRFFHLAAAYLFIVPRLKTNEVVVLDEGLVHRAINLYAWSTVQLDKEEIKKYIRLLPEVDHLFIIKVPQDVCKDRAEKRGFPKQLKEKSGKIINKFMENSVLIIEQIADLKAAPIKKMTVLDNSDVRNNINSVLQNCLIESQSAGIVQGSSNTSLLQES